MTGQELLELQEQVHQVQRRSGAGGLHRAPSPRPRAATSSSRSASRRAAALALLQAARATALLDGRDYVVPDDIVSNVMPVCAHRVISKTYMHDADGLAGHRIMQQVLETVPSPV